MKRLAVFWLLGIVLAAPAGAREMSEAAFDRVISDMQTATARLRDATYLFHKQEYVDGRQQPAQRIAVKYRAPYDIYMKWLEPVHAGRELLYRATGNRGRLRVSPGRWLPTLDLDPRGRLAMRGNRHSVLELPFPAIIKNFTDSAALIRANPALRARITDLGRQTHYGETAHCYHLQLPKAQEPRLYAAEVLLCVSLRTGLPLRIRSKDVEDGQLRQVEDYGYENVQLNVGLGDRDFDPDNPAYGF